MLVLAGFTEIYFGISENKFVSAKFISAMLISQSVGCQETKP